MAKKMSTIAEDAETGVSVASWTSRAFGMTPHVVLTVGALRDPKARRAIKLAAADARRVAIALLEAAEKTDATRSK